MDAVKPAPVPDVIVSMESTFEVWRCRSQHGDRQRGERERDWKLKDNQAHHWGGEETGDFCYRISIIT